MDQNTTALCAQIQNASRYTEMPVVVKYGTLEAKVTMKVVAVELDNLTGKVVIVVEA